jgi:hypothetical protein
MLSHGPSEIVLKNWMSFKKAFGTDPINESWDEAFDKALNRVRKWEVQIVKNRQQNQQRRIIKQVINSDDSSWNLLKG